MVSDYTSTPLPRLRWTPLAESTAEVLGPTKIMQVGGLPIQVVDFELLTPANPFSRTVTAQSPSWSEIMNDLGGELDTLKSVYHYFLPLLRELDTLKSVYPPGC